MPYETYKLLHVVGLLLLFLGVGGLLLGARSGGDRAPRSTAILAHRRFSVRFGSASE